MRSLGLRTVAEWRAWCRGDRPDLPPRPEVIPTGAANYYRDEWQGFRDWLREPRRARADSRAQPDHGGAVVRRAGQELTALNGCGRARYAELVRSVRSARRGGGLPYSSVSLPLPGQRESEP